MVFFVCGFIECWSWWDDIFEIENEEMVIDDK